MDSILDSFGRDLHVMDSILCLVRLLCYEFHLGILWERLTCDGFYFGLFVLLLDVDLLVMDSILGFLCSFLM